MVVYCLLAGFGNRHPAVCISDPFWLWTTFNLDVREEARLLGLVDDIVEAHKKIVGSPETIATCILNVVASCKRLLAKVKW